MAVPGAADLRRHHAEDDHLQHGGGHEPPAQGRVPRRGTVTWTVWGWIFTQSAEVKESRRAGHRLKGHLLENLGLAGTVHDGRGKTCCIWWPGGAVNNCDGLYQKHSLCLLRKRHSYIEHTCNSSALNYTF